MYHLAVPPIMAQGAILILLASSLHSEGAYFLESLLLMWILAPMSLNLLHFIFNVICATWMYADGEHQMCVASPVGL